MNLKKVLTGALIGAFIFGVSASSIQPVSAASSRDAEITFDKQGKTKNKFERTRNEMAGNDRNTDGKNPPEPPKDSNGNPIAPPDRNNNDNDRNADRR